MAHGKLQLAMPMDQVKESSSLSLMVSSSTFGNQNSSSKYSKLLVHVWLSLKKVLVLSVCLVKLFVNYKRWVL